MRKVDAFLQDERLKEAKKLIMSALADAQQSFTGIEAPKEPLIADYTKDIQQFNAIRGFPLFFPYIGSGLGKGALVELMDGSCKFDLISGVGVHYLGHSNPGVIDAALGAALSDTIMEGNLQTNGDALSLAALYSKLSGLPHAFLSTSGSMACENALKIAFHKKNPASRVLAFDRSFAGRTITLAQITDKASFRVGLPSVIAVDYIPFYDPEDPKASTEKTLSILKNYLRRYPHQHAVMCFELIQGEGGFWTAPPEFFKAIMDELKLYHIAIWIDEVQTFARTENIFAFKGYGLDEYVDIVTIGKVAHACATLYTDEFLAKPGLLSQTFSASTSAIRAAKFMIEYAIEHDFFGREGKIARLHARFTDGLRKLHEKYNVVHGPYGAGSMIAFTPFDGKEATTQAFVKKLFENGVISFVAGLNPTRARFLLPIDALHDEEIDTIMQIIEKTIQECMP